MTYRFDCFESSFTFSNLPAHISIYTQHAGNKYQVNIQFSSQQNHWQKSYPFRRIWNDSRAHARALASWKWLWVGIRQKPTCVEHIAVSWFCVRAPAQKVTWTYTQSPGALRIQETRHDFSESSPTINLSPQFHRSGIRKFFLEILHQFLFWWNFHVSPFYRLTVLQLTGIVGGQRLGWMPSGKPFWRMRMTSKRIRRIPDFTMFALVFLLFSDVLFSMFGLFYNILQIQPFHTH